MRNWHRWVMTVFGVTLVYWSVSGVIMAIYDASDATQVWAIEGGGPGARLTDAAKTAQPIPDPQTLNEGISKALAQSQIQIASVDLRMTGSTPRLELAEANGSRDTMGRYYAATGETMTAMVADGNPDAPQPDNVTLRNTLKMWHRGNIVGLPGQLVGLFTGLALIVLTITGVVMYLQLWQARRKTNRHGFFWSVRDTMWRRLHRWISIVSAALVLNLAVTGSILAYGELQLRVFLTYHIGAAPYPRPSPLPSVSSGVLPSDAMQMLQTTYQAALREHPANSITAIELVQREQQTKGIVTLGGAQPTVLAFDPNSGEATTDWRTMGKQVGNGYFADWHQMLKRIHRGDIIGNFGGRFIELAAGFALVYLTISGWVMYFEVKQRRAKMGRSGWFWR